ncbi:MAG: DJ-1/PfpI family protein [Oscillospiraceae bacterium]|nr:DJ-1/PfpI family protein [Oscillospiraceae bacterium]
MKKTAILLASGFEEVEALTAVDLLRRAGVQCDMVSLDGNATVTGSHGIAVGADLGFNAADFDGYDGVILPGGMPGTTHLGDDPRVLELLRRFAAAGKLTAAICAAPTVLGKAGLLRGKTAVCYPGMEDGLTGATVGTHPVERDGCVITSRGVGTAIPFALALAAYFCGEAKAEALAKSVVYG